MPFIVRIELSHDRKSFDCGNPALNDFLLKRGVSLYAGSTYVLVPDLDSPEIIAYFTIAPDPKEVLAGQYDVNPLLTRLVELRYLAVDKQYQRQGIGEDLLLEIMTQVVEIADSHKIDALVLEPIDSQAEQWYLRRDFGFQVTFIPDRKLILFVASMRTALASRS